MLFKMKFLKITKELYQFLMIKLEDVNNDTSPFDKAMNVSITLMEKDLEYTFPKYLIFEDEKKRKVKIRPSFNHSYQELKKYFKSLYFLSIGSWLCAG
jgi:hypothetical protein